MTLPAKYKLEFAAIQKALGKFPIEKLETGASGEVAKDESGSYWLTAASGAKYKLAKGEKAEALKAVEEGVAAGKAAFKVEGELKLAKDGDKEVETLVVSAASTVEKK